ncbi:MAG TPA: phenylalanine--tRNA ligase subunit beta [Candidatus Limnocylindrales bacterium]
MRVPLGWLADYVDIDLPPERLAERLTLLGMEVKGIERWGADWRNVVVGELLTVAKHPRADRLSLTTVTVGDGQVLEIVCGATNIAPGQRVPVALPGAVLPGERRIERTEKMGVVSNGMLCSGDELHLTSDADGILILPGSTPIGAELSDLYGDVVLDVDVKPNRGDALCLLGLAREVSAATGAPVRPPVIELVESGRPTAERMTVEVEEAGLCTRFVGRWVSGVRIAPSPERVQMRLQAAGMRPVSNVVDASNYVMLELGKPTHTFDGAAVRDGRIIVRLAREGERLETLDHVVRDLTPDTLIIADAAGVIGIAGVMGGAASEISDATTDVVIESAVFDPVSIRRTGQRYALRSEASLRFEKGQEHRLARLGADRVAQLLAAWAGGEVAPGVVDTDPRELDRTSVAFRPGRVNRLLGTSLSSAEQTELLGRVGVEVEVAPPMTPIAVSRGSKPLDITDPSGETLVAIVPTWRRDLAIEADVAEEVARVRGYELVPGKTPDTEMPAYRPAPLEVRDALRDLLAGAGLSEVVTHALVSPRHEELLRWTGDRTGGIGGSDAPVVPGDERAGGEPIRVTNPLSRDHSVMRRELIGSLLGVVGTNVRQGIDDVAIFEVGKGYACDDTTPEGTREWWRLALALTGQAAPSSWNRPPRAADLDDVKGLVELVARRLGFQEPTYAPDGGGYPFHPGRSALVRAIGAEGDADAGRVVLYGRVAELHPAVVEAFDVRASGRVVVAEVAVRGLAGGSLPVVRASTVAHVPAVERDIAVVVGEGVSVAAVAHAIWASGGTLLRGVRLFDIYRGAPLTEEDKSLAYRLLFQAPDRTLTEAELEAAVAAIRAGLREAVDARFRE